MKTKPLVVFCWVQAFAAAAILLFHFHNMLTRPAPGFEYSRRTGRVESVMPGGPAESAGIAIGDRVLTIDGHAIGPDVYPFFFVRAGERVPIVVERAGVRRTVMLVPVTLEELRRDQLRAGGRRAATAVSGYLNFPLHAWMFGLGVALFVLRPGNKDARLAALCLLHWVGSMFLFRGYGVGAALERLADPLPLLLIVVDAFFAAGFFAVAVHFALVFPTERRGVWEWLPYAAVTPIFFETLANGLARLRGDVRPVPLPLADAYSTIGMLMLLATLVILVVRFTRIGDANARRRLQLILLSLLPGALSFAAGYVAGVLQLGHSWNVAIRIVPTPATMLG
ncbi:MAG TPA: PDZ domain-containing protein, partial [Thermoanaerobaculia bacterium]|nr:PDZ domain-containing protein [Thermoanaerobaculia bacterium]